jgi:hypothetical protein
MMRFFTLGECVQCCQLYFECKLRCCGSLIKKQTIRFIKYDIQGVFLKCAEILPTRLFDNVED